jgi:hypothetical protein
VTCPRYATKELPQEAKASSGGSAGRNKMKKGASTTVKNKTFSMSTIKLHFIPDYPLAIEKLGTTDSYSTQIVSLLLYTVTLYFVEQLIIAE